MTDVTDMRALRDAIAVALRAPVPSRPGVPVVRIWGRDVDDSAIGPEANLWAGSPDDVAELILPALRDLIAERDQAVAAVERVRMVADERMRRGGWISAWDVRRALDPPT